MCMFNHNSFSYLSEKIFVPFELNDSDHVSGLSDVDPDLNFFSTYNQVSAKCNYYLESSFNEDIAKNTRTKDVFSVFHANIRSVSKNLNSLENYLKMLNHKFTIVGLTGTWLQNENSGLYSLNGYHFIGKHRVNRGGGGVAVCLKDHMAFSERNDISMFDDELESVFIEIDKSQLYTGKNVVVGVMYRPPNRDINAFNEKLGKIMDQIKSENKLCYLMGDYNINLLNCEKHDPTGQFFDVITSNGFLPIITRPTRVTATSATLIDNIFTNNILDVSTSFQGLFVTDLSDHYPIFHIDRQMKVKETEMFMYKRIFSPSNRDLFCRSLSETDWSEIYRTSDTQKAFDQFHNHLIALYNRCFPRIRVKKKYNNRKPWLSEALKNSIRYKNNLYQKYTKVKTAFNEDTYKRYKSKLQNLIKVAEKKFYQEQFTRYKSDMRKSWNVIKSIINRNKVPVYQTKFKYNGNEISDGNDISNKFNDFFINIGPTLASAIPNTNRSPLNYLRGSVSETIFISPVTENEISKLLLSLKNTATGYDDINSMSLKLCSQYVTQPLTHICNLSLTYGVFPDQMKVANVIPLYKSDDPMIFSHYRPVSLLCILSKVFEKIMYERIVAFLNAKDILYQFQFGFRPKYSPYLAQIMLIDKLTAAIENGDYAIGVFLDFSKAFDTVNHSILLDKLYHYGIRGYAYSWFKSYLSNRHQFVTYNGATSCKQVIRCGVPQGSILGPLLFLIYINDLSAVCDHSQPFLFADDTNLFISGKNICQLQQNMENDLMNIAEWLKANKLSLNIKKTHFMVFTNKNKTPPNMELHIGDRPIERVEHTKFLGMILDHKLTWKNHINFISNKIAKGIGIIKKVRKCLNSDTLISLYYSFVYPYMIYCNHVWGNTCKSNMNSLVLLQKKIIRIVCGVKPKEHTDPLLKKLKLLKCEDINKYLISRLMFRVHHRDITMLDGFFIKNSNIHNYNTRQTDHYHIPSFKTNLGKACFRYQGALIWNDILKHEIDISASDHLFAKNIKGLILQKRLWSDTTIPNFKLLLLYNETYSACHNIICTESTDEAYTVC